FVGEFGSLVDLPQVAIHLSPFVHAAVVPGTPMVALPLVVLLALAGALVAAAGVAFRRRDIG
ncbi:MAG: anibiotic ABC transporter, partial [Actinomycetota bacterium]|nr:anibiotic ABC transporter [Actinomycetota bacterium]